MFSELQWGATTDEFMTNVQQLSDKKVARIIAGALEYAPKKSAVASTSRRVSGVSRLVMQISDDDVSECE